MDKNNPYKTIDEYIDNFPLETQKILQKIRKIAKKNSPEAQEAISYGIPTLKLNGKYFIYFGGYKNHVSLYPVPDGPDEFKKEISKYIAGKGTLKFSLDKKIPYELIEKIVEYARRTNESRVKDYS